MSYLRPIVCCWQWRRQERNSLHSLRANVADAAAPSHIIPFYSRVARQSIQAELAHCKSKWKWTERKLFSLIFSLSLSELFCCCRIVDVAALTKTTCLRLPQAIRIYCRFSIERHTAKSTSSRNGVNHYNNVTRRRLETIRTI